MRIRSKLLLAMTVPLALLIAQIVAVNSFIRELQAAVTFIASAHTVIEADFEAVELVSSMRKEVKQLPSRYVADREQSEGEAVDDPMEVSWRRLTERIELMRRSEAAQSVEGTVLQAVFDAFDRASKEYQQSKAMAAVGEADLDTLLERAIFIDKGLRDLGRALGVLAIELRGRLQAAVDRERAIHNRPIQAGIVIGILAVVLLAVFAALFAGYFVRPIRALMDGTERIAQGHLDEAVPVRSRDELGVLTQRFNDMAAQLKQSFATLETQNRELQRLDKLKDEFLANTSHELRTPLNGIIGLAESLLDGATGTLHNATRKNLAMIVSSGKRLASLVNDILDFSKLQNQELDLQTGPVDIHALAEVALTLSQPLVGRKALTLNNETATDLPLVEADENRMQQILLNLIGNAIKFTERGAVTVSAEVRDRYLEVTVADTGIGIPAEKFERIFESFQQADGTTAREYGGTGLGLAVSQQLVELQGGQIGVSSKVGVGSKFAFTLPLAETDAASAEIARPDRLIARIKTLAETDASADLSEGHSSGDDGVSSAPEALVSGHRQRVLVIDDEPVNLQVLSNHLGVRDYQVDQAQNGPEALRLIEQGPRYDLVVLDVMMPRMSGYEVCRRLRKRFSADELPVILLSAKNQVTDLVTGLRAGANDYLTKPISKEELLARIETHLSLKTLLHENLRLAAELEVTQKLQKMLLPGADELRRIDGLDIAGFMEPADEIGGDYYDVLNYNGRVKIGIGDVTGHGLESGVVMLMTQTAVRTLLNSGETDPRRFLTTLNHTVYDNIQRMGADKNLTLALLDYAAGGDVRLSGQHEELIVVRGDGAVERVDTIDLGFPIGLDVEIGQFVDHKALRLQPGDGMVLYTDGITEAENSAGEQYGLDRLCQMLSQCWGESAEGIKNEVVADVRHHIGDHQVYDDITLLVMKQI